MNSNQELSKKIGESLKDEKLDALMMECVSFLKLDVKKSVIQLLSPQKGIAMMFKELKLEKDGMPLKDAVSKHIESEIKDEDWKPIFKAAVDKCLKNIETNKDKIISEMEKAPLNMKKDQCNVLPFVLIACFHIEGMMVRIF